MNFKIGIGYDVHALQEGLDFWLGGVKIEHNKGCLAYSDGDVLIHAICDAILGAANLRDIGYNFPDTDNKYKGIDSCILLQKSLELINNKGYKIVNVDSVILLQTPKLKDYIPLMKQKLASVMEIDIEDISIKASTTEKLGFVGREEGIVAQAVVLITK
ncbi:MAG: 2-C-methyl-D-erythritol 2,4-cyclodiphosphate synthase [Bacteroidota bacterium]|jgi:2-C-methyl-D-erythritol 2,4-cyclodiphosphate synthase|nr:2-C-methyl-D-erythritol 2,4-cyclodiphosphate synthase [Bacteroidales bacterium]MDI9535482.1 2-C-methyl-D-erythritol 2,4-cyclodiphosphate synthase [Bacteroidota bacterium]OQC45281.1 MAG: 2-C-methyl-D-erythritol 2,4-cyclodiphosphate synthase [Bacteroidetes bacterium ADurb.Bin028]NLP19819.1 2-C-methyl-D-erythritol 2,4-cyclodiphosphate synthase [Bacteroidales bacterium]HNY43495.1 2-C-methyl-D-erythritol 2,4-cyclodiphosphate synthase [Bacteroidales bacterium]